MCIRLYYIYDLVRLVISSTIVVRHTVSLGHQIKLIMKIYNSKIKITIVHIL